MKTCTSCRLDKLESEFHKRARSLDKLSPICKPCKRSESATRYASDPEKYIAQASAYIANNREKHNAARRALQKRKMANPVFRLSRIIRSRTNHVLKGRHKTGRSVEYLGCDFDQLKLHLEAQFLPGMTWDNYGKRWHVDHRDPLATLPLDAPDSEVRRLAHFTNLRPQWAEVNMSEGGKLRHRVIP